MIIKSLLDTDFYKFTMGQFIWKYYPDILVSFSFKNRTENINLLEYIDIKELDDEIYNVRKLKFTFKELLFLKNQNIFDDEYLEFLSTLELPPVYVYRDGKELKIFTFGRWKHVVYWETFILSIVNELYSKKVGKITNHSKSSYLEYGLEELDYKINVIQLHPIKFSDFGTRRRFSCDWQREVLEELKEKLPNTSFLGTSNVYFAKELGLKPIGTFAHELPMVICGTNPDDMKKWHRAMLNQWYILYGEPLSIALTDTYGTDFFFKEGIEFPEKWKGLRQDSGCPFKFAQKALDFYRSKGIDSKEKIIVFSDGLDIDKIMKIEKEVKPHFKTIYGWGTNLTNDCGINPLSIVMKTIKADGHNLVKLSDNLAKAIGDEVTVNKYKKVFKYNNTFNQKVVY